MEHSVSTVPAPPRSPKRARPKLAACLTFVAPLSLTAPTRISLHPLRRPHPLCPPREMRHLRPARPADPARPAQQPVPPARPARRPRRVAATASSSSDTPRPNLTTVSERFLSAVEKLSRQPRQTVSDIAATAGIPVAEAADEAVLLASLVSAPIDVTDAGDLAYRFPQNVRSVLRARSALSALAMAWRRAAPALFLFARVAFGALLVVSILVTFVAITALAAASSSSSSSSSSSDDNRRSSFGPSLFGPRLFAPDIFDIMFYSSRYPPRQRNPGEMSFFEAVYSFVFGDADPNADFAERRWRTVAAVIRANRGAVTAEQLAPYLDPPSASDTSASSVVDESFMLPALTRFQGHPEVTEEGDIIYVFPDFVKTGRRSAAGRTEMAGSLSTAALIEEEVPLTRAPPGQRILVTGLGVVNVAGVLVLGSKLLTVVPVTADAAALVAGIRTIYGPLFAYAASFFIVPLIRWFRLRGRNEKIRSRNSARQQAASALRLMNPSLREKMQAAEKYVIKGGEVRDDNVIYSSDQELIDQTKMQEDLADDFDRRLNR